MLLVIDNYDSFTYNLVQYLGETGEEILVRRNDDLELDELGALAPRALVISPGPGVPADAGISVGVIRRFGPSIPILGVCLGHQAIGEAYGARVVRAKRLMHGKTSRISHTADGIFADLPSPLEVMRYHSLVLEAASIPEDLQVIASSQDDPSEVQAVRHRRHPVWGVQFHPESILTSRGRQILNNFLDLAR